MSQMYYKTPSELLGITDEYTGFCLDEACAYIRGKISEGQNPVFHKKYSSFTDMYSAYSGG